MKNEAKDERNIYQRINAVMNDCEYLQKKKAQQGKGIKYDEVIAMLREHLIKHGVVMVINQEGFESIGKFDTNNQVIYQGKYVMDLVNMDNPDEKVTHSVFAQGMDGGDKAPGKAITYATKISLLKVFSIETGINDESRAEARKGLETITAEQAEELDTLIEQTKTDANRFRSAYKIKAIDHLPANLYHTAKAQLETKKAK